MIAISKQRFAVLSRDSGSRVGGGEDGQRRLDNEESSADQNADEDEEEALLLEDVVEGAGEGSGVLKGFGGVRRRFGGRHFFVLSGA